MPQVRIRFRTLGLMLPLCAGIVAVAIAQPSSKPRTPAPPKAAAAAGAPTAAAPVAAAPAPASEPIGESPLLVEPKTAAELFDAAILTERLDRPGLAKRYLEKLVQSNPSDDVLVALRTAQGPAIFVQLASHPGLQPAATQLLERVTAAFKKHSDDPAFLDTLIRGLAGSPSERDDATAMLKNIGPSAVPRILQHIETPEPRDNFEILVQSLVQMGDSVVPPLLGGLESSNDVVRNAALQTLGLLQAKSAVPYLLPLAFDEKQPTGIRVAAQSALARILRISTGRGEGVSGFGAPNELKRAARDHLANRVPWPTTDGIADLWTWNEGTKTVELHRLPPASASLYTGLRFARQALALVPEDREAQVLFLALYFAWDAQGAHDPQAQPPAQAQPSAQAQPGIRIGPGTPHNVALEVGPDVVSDTLALGLETQIPAVSLGAIGAMAGVGARQQLYGSHPRRSPLLAALNSPSPEVRYAAAVAILRADPDKPFREAQAVVQVLTQAMSKSTNPVAIVIDANRGRGNELAGILNQYGFDAEAAVTGKEGFELATSRSNVVLVAVNANVIRWPLSQTLSNFRADARSAQVPIIIYGTESVRVEVRSALANDPQITYMIESTTPQQVQMEVGDFLKRALARAEQPIRRAERVADAVSWLAFIANANRTNIFNLQSAQSALLGVSTDSKLYVNALDALAALPTAAVQRHLQKLSVSELVERGIRDLAPRHLAAHIQRYGLLLSATEVAELELAWRSEQNPDTITALAAVVGSLKPNARRVGSRLQSIAAPLKPTP